jgi:hypothetical protein
MIRNDSRFSMQAAFRCALACITVFGVAYTMGCGGGGNDVAPPPPPPQTTITQVRIGDGAADRVLFFALKIGSPLTLHSTAGQDVVYSIGNNRWELTHAAGKFEPLSTVDLAQGTYSSVDLVVVSPGMVYLDSNGVPQGILGNPSQSVTVNFNPPLQIGSTPTVLNMDVNVANSLAVDGSGYVTGFDFKSSSFTFTSNAIGQQSQQQDANGEIEGLSGKVTTISGSNFVVEAGQGNSELGFASDSSTVFSGGLGDLGGAANQIVKIDGYTKPDGTLMATKLEGMENQTGAIVEGLVTAVNLAGGTFQIEVQDGTGAGMDPNKVGALYTVNFQALSSGDFSVDWGKTDTAGLIPGSQFLFDAPRLHSGQRVEVQSSYAVPDEGGVVVARKIRLQQQAFTGTVSNFVAGGNNSAQFDLILPNDGSSYMKELLAGNVIHIYQPTGTHNAFGSIANQDRVRVRGLIFNSSGYNLIARRITAP